MIHSDICSDHILWDGRSVTGIIDWADARISDPAADFGGLIMSYGKRFARHAMEHYHTDDPGLVDRPAEVYLHVGLLGMYEAGIMTENTALERSAIRHIRRAIRGSYPTE